ncbi:NlpC/P60 family protein [Curtobacterium citreum]
MADDYMHRRPEGHDGDGNVDQEPQVSALEARTARRQQAMSAGRNAAKPSGADIAAAIQDAKARRAQQASTSAAGARGVTSSAPGPSKPQAAPTGSSGAPSAAPKRGGPPAGAAAAGAKAKGLKPTAAPGAAGAGASAVAGAATSRAVKGAAAAKGAVGKTAGAAAGAAKGATGAAKGAATKAVGAASRIPGAGRMAAVRRNLPRNQAVGADGGKATAGEQAKNLGKDALAAAAKGALTGGVAGAAKGVVFALVRNKWAMGLIGGSAAVALLAPLVLMGAMTTSTNSAAAARKGYDTTIAMQAATQDGVKTEDVKQAQIDVGDSDIPWQIWLAYERNGGDKVIDKLAGKVADEPTLEGGSGGGGGEGRADEEEDGSGYESEDQGHTPAPEPSRTAEPSKTPEPTSAPSATTPPAQQTQTPAPTPLANTGDSDEEKHDDAVEKLIDDMQSKMATDDGNVGHWDLLAGTVLADGKTAQYKLSKDDSDKSVQDRAKKLWTGVLTDPGDIDKDAAEKAFDAARNWALGTLNTCGSGSTGGSGGGGGAGTAPAVSGPPTETAPVDARPGGTLETLAPGQINNARAIMGIAKTMFGASPDEDQKRAAEIGIITAIVESNIENLDYGDRDSIGAFQQRNTWGSHEQRLNIFYSSTAFLRVLIARPNWATNEPGSEAQGVQISAFPDRYSLHMNLATALVDSYWDGVDPIPLPNPPAPPGKVTDGHGNTIGGSGGSTGPDDASGGSDSGSGGSSTKGCSSTSTPFTGGSIGAGDPGPENPGPGAKGNTPQADGAKVATALAFASMEVGKPYVLGGAGPDVWDCSGLTMKAYGAAGIRIGLTNGIEQHSSGTQFRHAPLDQVFPWAERERGDLVFWTNGGSGTYHVAIYLGQDKNGTDWQIAATKPGSTVKIQPVWGQGGDLETVVVRPTVGSVNGERIRTDGR